MRSKAEAAALPDPDALHPVPNKPRIVFLKPLLATMPGITNCAVGDFTYYDDPLHAKDFFRRNVIYNFQASGARLEIGKFCALATGVRFMMPDAMHAMAGPSTYPFGIMGGAFASALPLADYPWRESGDTVLGHDIWLGMEALVMPGVRIGHGAVIGARAVVTRDVPDYAVAAGNPAVVRRRRFAEEDAARLVALAWWDWPAARIARAIPVLAKGGVTALEDFAAAEA
ncbi:CatB-related O-acetyltransferase [Falsiroseomonas sp.]|uniref:CatB-related O-acetyltransferase n=1 Tax=Falsiroseomonas sp. TaxID=2870721 RepID=UPI002732D87F|nr:CatB-related O-acetyltransferase [Falsiroseomonas sp.]MDP3419177.1 CatB-related O-acetyltransferase [Falsiroseomonas sp.]